MTVTADDRHTLTGAYALDALDDNERRMFEEHLETCADCRAEVAEFAATAAYLGMALAVAPPPQLRDRVLTEIRQVRQLPPERSNVVPLRGVSRRRFNLVAAAASILAALALALGVIAYQSDQRADELAAQVEQQQQDVEALAEETQRIADVLAAPDVERTFGEVRDGGAAAAVASAELGEVILLTRDLPALAADLDYQLWFIGGDPDAPDIVSGGVLDVPQDGDLTLVTEGDLDEVSTIAMSIEPSGGSEQPTDVVFLGPLE
ncbi:MAG TPA: anti-sigma factor [Jiangellaceae bacterium]|jgi:anti-sigma-K factor RskA|nr:anti-sigma factor [Jiangellaceae bacterium]